MARGKRVKKGHGFSKFVLFLCFLQLTAYSVWQAYVFQITGNEASTLTQWFFTFWGIEVALLMIKRVMEDKKPKSSDYEDCEESE
jgi:hypothetical protein